MKGYYIRFQCEDLPSLKWMYHQVIRGPFTAAYHDHFDGGVLVEVVCAEYPVGAWVGCDITPVSVVEFYSNSLLEVGGVYVDETGVSNGPGDSPPPASWKKKMGELAFALDSIDIAHPRALHASEYII